MTRKTYNGISPIKVPENEKVVSIAFPSEASSITSLDIPETATIDVTACNDDFVWGVLNDTTKPNKKITANNKIYYTATEKVIPNPTSALPTITSHEFIDGKGVITFATDLTSISDGTFADCSGLTSITIPDSVTSIGQSAFTRCSGLTSITIPDSVTSIGNGAFNSCKGLTSITIPDSVTNIGGDAFSSCSGITEITIPDGVKTIGNFAFSSMSKLKTVYYNAINATTNNFIFPGTPVENLIFDQKVQHIPQLFGGPGNTSLTSITIPDSVTIIGRNAFDGCRSLTSITIPDSVTSIGDWAFNYCSGLTSITFKGTTAQWDAITKATNWNYRVPTTCQVVCTDGTVSI